MKTTIALITASLLSLPAFAAEPAKKEEKKAEAKPATTASKDVKPAPKKEEAKK